MAIKEIKISIDEGLVGSRPKVTPTFPAGMSINEVLDVLVSIVHHITTTLLVAEKNSQSDKFIKGGPLDVK